VKNKITMTYSYLKTLKKGVKYFVLFLLASGICYLTNLKPEIANLTIGGLLVMLYDYLKHKWGIRLP